MQKVYTVGPDYAHAEARKSPALDGKVERDSEGKEVRYPVILNAREKLIAWKVCLAFKVRCFTGHTGSCKRNFNCLFWVKEMLLGHWMEEISWENKNDTFKWFMYFSGDSCSAVDKNV